MARFNTTVESAVALASTAPSGGTANQLFANLRTTAATQIRLRRLTFGVRAGTGAPTSQQMTIAMVRTTAVGTVTGHSAAFAMDPNSAASNAQVDTAWSTVPTATWTAPYNYEVSFNTQSGVDLPWELLEEWLITGNATNGMAFINVGNGLPSSHVYTASFEWEE